MIYSNLSAGQVAFLIIVPIVVIGVIAAAIYFPMHNKKVKSDFRYFYYKRIYKVAMDNDYYLINDFLFKIDNSHVGRIDHILFADKYIYLITDCYYDGNIDGKEKDTSFILVSQDGKKTYVNNPVLDNRKLIDRLCLLTGLDQSLMIGVIVINDNCQCAVETSVKNAYIIQSKRFKALVKAIESRDIANIKQEQLASAVKAIDKLNRKKKKNEQK